MKRQEQAEAVLNRFFEECATAVPTQSEVDPVLDRVWERLEWRADEFVEARMPAATTRPFRFAWAAGLALTVVLVSVLVWREGPPFSTTVMPTNDRTLSRLSSQQAGEILPVTVPTDEFEVASVKVLDPSSNAFKQAKTSDEFGSALLGCSGSYSGGARIDPGRLTIPSFSIVGLILTAYGVDCKLVEGGTSWARSGEYYEINALLPPGTPSYTQQDLFNSRAPELQRMLQNLLANRFRLVLKREFREMPVYALTVAKPGKMTVSSPEEAIAAPAGFPAFPGTPGPQVRRGQIMGSAGIFTGEIHLAGHATSMSDLAKSLRQYAARRVVDKTGLKDLFDLELKFVSEVPLPVPPGMTPQPPRPELVPSLPSPALRTALEDLGLKLEPTRLPVEVLIIESVERPSEN
jgi:uncharacterized protein (TIGR03435 family)